jgi:hypothetical protein
MSAGWRSVYGGDKKEGSQNAVKFGLACNENEMKVGDNMGWRPRRVTIETIVDGDMGELDERMGRIGCEVWISGPKLISTSTPGLTQCLVRF